MEKRLVLAIALSLLVLLSWSALAPKPQVIDNKGVITGKTQLKSLVSQNFIDNQASTLTQPVLDSAKEIVKFTQDNREIVFDSARAAIVEVVFKNKLEHRLPLKIGLFSDNSDLFKQESIGKEQISFVYQDQNKRIIKKFIIPKDSYAIDLEIRIQNLSSSPLLLYPQIILGRLDLSTKNNQSRYQDIFLSGREKALHISAGKEFTTKDVNLLDYVINIFVPFLNQLIRWLAHTLRKLTPRSLK